MPYQRNRFTSHLATITKAVIGEQDYRAGVYRFKWGSLKSTKPGAEEYVNDE
jgi:hypothetical protein